MVRRRPAGVKTSRRGGMAAVSRPAAPPGRGRARPARAASELGWPARGVVPSPLPGPSGNVEFFLWLRSGGDALSDADIARVVTAEDGGGG